MTYKYFENTINTILKMYEKRIEIDDSFSKIFGNDSTIISPFFNKEIQDLIDNLSEELNDKENKWLEYLIFEVMMSNKDKDYTIVLEDKTKLIASPKSIWFILTGEKIA
jgi:hypothetical protein